MELSRETMKKLMLLIAFAALAFTAFQWIDGVTVALRFLVKLLFPFLLGAAVAVYGLTVFFRRDFPTYLFLRSQFVFLDFSESPLVFYGDHLALMGTFVFLAWALARRRGKVSA